MTDKITLTNLVNLQNETTAVNAINSNNAVLTTAMDNTLSRDGTSPNQMGSTLDMNSNPIINLPAPNTTASPVRLEDLNTVMGGGTLNIINIPAGGTTGQELVKTSNVDYQVGWSGTRQVIAGGVTGQSLTKNSNSDYDTKWAFPSSAGVSSFNTLTGAVVQNYTGYYAGLQPLKRPDINNFTIGVNPGSFGDSAGAQIYSTTNVLVCDLSTSSIDTSGTRGGGIGGTPGSPIPVGCCLSPGPLAGATSIFDGIDFMLYLVKRNSDGLIGIVADNSNVYGGSLLATIGNGSNSWTTGGPPCGFWNGTRVRLTTTGTLPSGFSTNTDYFVVNETNGQLSTTFGLAPSYGGTAITAGSTFTGAISVHYGVQDHLDAQMGAGTWTVLRGIHFGWRWRWQWPGAGGGIPDFTADPRADKVYLTYSGSSQFSPNSIPGGGVATSATSIDLTPVLSNLNRIATIRTAITSTGSAGTVYIGAPGSPSFRPFGEGPTTGTTTTYGVGDVQTDSQGLISYFVTGGAKLANLWVEGWNFVDPR